MVGARRIAGLTAAAEVFTVVVDAWDEVAHTIVVAAEGANPRVIILADDQPLPDVGTARLRFLPLDAAAGPLDLAVAGGPILAVGVAPFTVGPSVAVPAGTAGLDVRAPGRPEPLPAKPPPRCSSRAGSSRRRRGAPIWASSSDSIPASSRR